MDLTTGGMGKTGSDEGRYAFGFWARRRGLSDEAFRITMLPGREEVVHGITTHSQVRDGWFEPPIVSDPGGFAVPTARFELPLPMCWRRLVGLPMPSSGVSRARPGLFSRLRLNVEGVGHLRRAAVSEGLLVNFVAYEREILHVIRCARDFWDGNRPEVRRLAFGAVHWHLSAQSYDALHDEFAWAYSVLDGLHRLARLTTPSYATRTTKGGREVKHGERPSALAGEFGVPLPSSFAGGSAPTAALVKARNTLIHEARWDGGPIGYSVSEKGHDMVQDLRHFFSQVILRLLGVNCGFCGHPYDRQLQGLDILHSEA